MRPTRQRSVCLLAGWLICGAAIGCGSAANQLDYPRAGVSGHVLLDGQPLAKGIILFDPVEGTPGPKTSVPVVDGWFSVDEDAGPVVGEHRIEIHSADDGGYAFDDEEALEQLKESRTKRIDVVRVPPAFNTHSQMKRVVNNESPNKFDFDLTTPRRSMR